MELVWKCRFCGETDDLKEMMEHHEATCCFNPANKELKKKDNLEAIDFKGDGAFERAWKTVCKKHNHKHLYYKDCPLCVDEAKKQAVADLNHNTINACHNLYALAETTALQDEIDKIIDAVNNYTKSLNIQW